MFIFDSLRMVLSSIKHFGAALFFGCGDFSLVLFFSPPDGLMCFILGKASEFALSDSALLVSFLCLAD